MEKSVEVLSITTDEAAELIGVSARTVRRACERGEIQAVKVQGRWRVIRKALLNQFGAPEDR